MDEQEHGQAPSAHGLLQCLKALAQEAASLHLFRTLSAIEDALEAAATESGLHALEDTEARVLH